MEVKELCAFCSDASCFFLVCVCSQTNQEVAGSAGSLGSPDDDPASLGSPGDDPVAVSELDSGCGTPTNPSFDLPGEGT